MLILLASKRSGRHTNEELLMKQSGRVGRISPSWGKNHHRLCFVASARQGEVEERPINVFNYKGLRCLTGVEWFRHPRC